MKVLVTGGAGYIGSITSLLLTEAGYDVVVFDNLLHGHRSAVSPPVRLIPGDLADAGLIDRVIKEEKPDCVMHFAALIAVGESVEKPDLYFSNNVGCGLNLLNAVGRNRTPRFIFSSTAAVYGTPQQVPISELAPLQPNNPYGESKRFFEELLAAYARIFGFSYSILRYFNVGGAYRDLGEDHRPETHLIPRILRSFIHPGESFEIYGADYPTRDGTCVRDFIHIYDLARAHLLVLQALNDKNLLFNIGSETGYTVKEVFAACERVLGKKIDYRVVPRRPGDVPVLVASSAKIKRELGWKPEKGLEDIVRDAWEWLQAHPHGYPD